jgi:hypothetical protein
MAPWDKPRDIGGIKNSEDAENFPREMPLEDALKLAKQAGYTVKGKLKKGSYDDKAIVLEHPEYADLLIAVDGDTSPTAYHASLTPKKGSKGDGKWDKKIEPVEEKDGEEKGGLLSFFFGSKNKTSRAKANDKDNSSSYDDGEDDDSVPAELYFNTERRFK